MFNVDLESSFPILLNILQLRTSRWKPSKQYLVKYIMDNMKTGVNLVITNTNITLLS